MEGAYWLGAIVGAALGAAIGVGGAALSTHGSTGYGTVVFVGLPVLQGMVAAFVTQMPGPRDWKACAGSSMFSLFLSAFGVLVFAQEGIVCLIMAAPLIMPLVLLGAWIGWLAGGGKPQRDARLALPVVAVVALAATGGPITHASESNGEVTTVWQVAASARRVWPHVLGLRALPEPDWWLFRMGVAYPVRTRSEADGRRECLLSTGSMPEVVTRREEGRRLAFRVLATPSSMREWNPFGEVRAAHLTTTYRGIEGEFRLFSEVGGGTRIVARSRYGLRMAPFWYWRLWSDAIVAHVHERVVREIARRATEPDGRRP